jgi:hypothetical protein
LFEQMAGNSSILIRYKYIIWEVAAVAMPTMARSTLEPIIMVVSLKCR